MNPFADPKGFVEAVKPYAALGAVQVQIPNPVEGATEWAAKLGQEIVPALADL